MKSLRFNLIGWLLALLALSVVQTPPPQIYARPPETCGSWRWDIKTLSDSNASRVDFTPIAATIRGLRDLDEPEELGPRTPRIPPTEYRVFKIRARLLAHKWVCCRDKDDGDYHLVIADPRSRKRTMIAEIADPECPGARDSVRVQALRAVRRQYDDLIGQPPRGRFEEFEDPPVLFITGIGFFDEVHGQRGVALNGIQLHPVLDVEEVP